MFDGHCIGYAGLKSGPKDLGYSYELLFVRQPRKGPHYLKSYIIGLLKFGIALLFLQAFVVGQLVDGDRLKGARIGSFDERSKKFTPIVARKRKDRRRSPPAEK